jgi:oligopeptide/dipeptide ABC transporter ATP-binding protein
MTQPLIAVNNLSVHFATEQGTVKAVDGVSFHLNSGETLGLVGESGCGKSVTALSLLRLIPSPPGKIQNGEILYQQRDLLRLPLAELMKLRGRDLGMIFQEPLTSFNPVWKIGRQIQEALQIHTDLTEREMREKVIGMLHRVGLPDPERQYNAYPHELSGGMRQRAMIAMALICRPQAVIADEPTTALDVTIQAQILDLLQELQAENGMSVLLITHNLGIVAETAGRVAVMYAGKIVEQSTAKELFRHPLHPYAEGLLRSAPTPQQTGSLYAIPGQIPDPFRMPPGCAFEPRCPRAAALCREKSPLMRQVAAGHEVACWRIEN